MAWVMPVYGPIHRLVYESHMAAMGALAKQGIVVEPKFVVVSNKMGLAGASNKITESVMDLKPDYIFWTEMDMILPSHTVTTLLKHATEHNLDVLSGIYFLRGNGQPCLYKKVVEGSAFKYAHTPMLTFPKDALFEVGCPGVGCVLFKTEVFNKIEAPYWDDKEGECGQDMYFYTNLRNAGVKVYADSTVICGQIDDDVPRLWDEKDYEVWLRSNEGENHGYIQGDTKDVISIKT